jgi:cell division protein FtsW
MAKRVSVDRWMFTVATILVFVGLVMIFSASAVMAKERFGSAYEFLLKQLVWAFAGLAVMVMAMKVDYKRLQHPALVFSFLGFTTLLLISVSCGSDFVAAFGTGQARAHPVSRVVS